MCMMCQPSWSLGRGWADGNLPVRGLDQGASRSYLAYPVASSAGNGVSPDLDGGDGQGGTTTSVSATGDLRIDGLLTAIRWTNPTLTYSDPDAAADYQAGYFLDRDGDGISAQNDGFGQLSANQRIAIHFALNATILTQPAGAAGFSLEGFTNVSVDYAGSGSGAATLRYANTSDNSFGWGFFPSTSIYGGDGWLGSSIQTPLMGNYSWNNTLHEIGHTLGLKHGHETTTYGALPSNVDSLEYTVMTYRSYIGAPLTGYTNESGGYPQTYMMLDIAALQHMYGADFTTNAGNTTYSWNPLTGATSVNGVAGTTPAANRVFMTIWDGGGTDTYDLSNYTTALTINLAPGSASNFGTQLAYLGGGPNGGYARGNVFNALQYQNDPRSLIENALGGSGNDTIHGNEANNGLWGNGGSDTIFSFGGADSVFGGDGIDTIYLGAGDDYAQADAGASSVLVGEGGNDTLYGGAGGDYMVGDDGVDTLVGLGGVNSMYGGAGDDLLISGDGAGSVIDGGAGANQLWGGSGADYCVGGELNDLVVGAGGSDYCFGNAGADAIYAGAGTDYIFGNAGNDFIYTDDVGFTLQDYVYVGGATGVDTIVDFRAGSGGDVLVVNPASGLASFAQLQAAMTQVGLYTVITMSGGDQVYLYNLQPFQLTADNFIFF